MTYQNDPHNRRPAVTETNYTPWILGALGALALIVGIFFMSGNRNNTSTATNTRPAATMPATTGSGATNVPVAPTAPAAPITPAPPR